MQKLTNGSHLGISHIHICVCWSHYLFGIIRSYWWPPCLASWGNLRAPNKACKGFALISHSPSIALALVMGTAVWSWEKSCVSVNPRRHRLALPQRTPAYLCLLHLSLEIMTSSFNTNATPPFSSCLSFLTACPMQGA